MGMPVRDRVPADQSADRSAWQLIPGRGVCCDYLHEKPESLFDNIGKQACKRLSRHQVRTEKL